MAKIFQPEDWVYVPTATFEVGGQKLPITGLTLYLSAGGLPRVVAKLDIFHKDGEPGDEAVAPPLAAFGQRWQEFQENIRDRKNRQVNITFDAGDVTGENVRQQFELKDWIMISAGISDVSARGGASLLVEAVHPLYAFQESSAHLFGSAVQAVTRFDDLTQTKNVYEALIAAMKLYAKAHDIEALAIPAAEDVENYVSESVATATDTKKIVDEYNSMVEVLEQYLEWDPDWDGDGFPSVPFDTNLKDLIPYGVVEYVKSMDNAGSWDWLVRSFCAEWFLTIYPSMSDGKMKMRPIEPWAPFKMTIHDTDISQMQLPPVDPTPIKAVLGLFYTQTISSVTWGTSAEGMQEIHTEEISWTEDSFFGKVLMMAIPGWMRDLLFNRACYDSGFAAPVAPNLLKGVTFTSMANVSESETGTIGTVNPDYWHDQQTGMQAVCKELFLENYRQHYQTALLCRLMIKHDKSELAGNWILPGFVMQVTSNPDQSTAGQATGVGEPILAFYVTQVVHSIDCSTGQANTQFAGSYVREPGGPSGKALDAGEAFNGMYKDFSPS